MKKRKNINSKVEIENKCPKRKNEKAEVEKNKI